MNEKYLPAVVINPKGPAKACVIWLHGLGADGHDFEAIVPELNLPESAGIRFLFPHAPKRPVTINGGYTMRAWYDIAVPDLSREVDVQGIRASQGLVKNLVDREVADGLEPAKIILAGFSQGGVIALETGARYPERLGGVIALSCYLPLPDEFPPAFDSPLPILMLHGALDPVVPLPIAERSRAVLQNKGYSVDWQTYPMPHAVCLEEIEKIGRWLLRRLT